MLSEGSGVEIASWSRGVHSGVGWRLQVPQVLSAVSVTGDERGGASGAAAAREACTLTRPFDNRREAGLASRLRGYARPPIARIRGSADVPYGVRRIRRTRDVHNQPA